MHEQLKTVCSYSYIIITVPAVLDGPGGVGTLVLEGPGGPGGEGKRVLDGPDGVWESVPRVFGSMMRTPFAEDQIL